MTTKRINNMDSRFRGNDDNFVARIERTTAGMQEVEQRMEQLPSEIRGDRVYRGCING